jgi:hypothetical protein
MSDSPPQIPPGTPLAVTLSFQQWRELVEVLADAPFRKVSMLVGQIERQCGEQLNKLAPTLRSNGAAAGEHAHA